MKNELMTKKKFQTAVLDRARALKIPHIEAALLVAEQNKIQPEDCARFIDGNLKDRIEAEAQGLNMVKGSTTGNLLGIMGED